MQVDYEVLLVGFPSPPTNLTALLNGGMNLNVEPASPRSNSSPELATPTWHILEKQGYMRVLQN
jgi:hypothetical protein